MLKKRDNARIVEIPVSDVVSDLHTAVPVGYCALNLCARRIGILQRDLTKRDQPIGRIRRDLQSEVVENSRNAGRFYSRASVVKKHRRGRNDLSFDAVSIHVRESQLRIPRDGRDASKLSCAEHDRRFTLRLNSKPERIDP